MTFSVGEQYFCILCVILTKCTILVCKSFQLFAIFLSYKKCTLEHVVNKLMSS